MKRNGVVRIVSEGFAGAGFAKSNGAEYVCCSNRACGYFCWLDELARSRLKSLEEDSMMGSRVFFGEVARENEK